MGFSCVLKRLAAECDIRYADVFDSQGMAVGIIDQENGVHPNNLGHASLPIGPLMYWYKIVVVSHRGRRDEENDETVAAA